MMKRAKGGRFLSKIVPFAQLPSLPLNPIRIHKPSLDDEVVEGNPCLRGVINPQSISSLRIDSHYQRDLLSLSTRRFILQALSTASRLPDIELGMRGQNWEFTDDNDVLLLDPVFVIDGQQRRGTILEYLGMHPDYNPHLGVIVHFGTNMEWERNRFQLLGGHRTNISGAILIRNMRSTCPGVATIYGLSQTDQTFPLHNKVGWGQTMLVKDMISAPLYARAILNMHGHLSGGITVTQPSLMEDAFNKLVRATSLPILRNNTKTFFNLLDNAWGIKDLQVRGAPWLRGNFLISLTDLISDHEDFWTGANDQTLTFSATIREKIESFPISDPQIRMLAAAHGTARDQLIYHLMQHINKGRRISLRKRDVTAITLKHRTDAARARFQQPLNDHQEA